MLQPKLLDLLQVVLLLGALPCYDTYHIWQIDNFSAVSLRFHSFLVHDESREKDAKVFILGPRGGGDQEGWGGGRAGEWSKVRKGGR